MWTCYCLLHKIKTKINTLFNPVFINPFGFGEVITEIHQPPHFCNTQHTMLHHVETSKSINQSIIPFHSNISTAWYWHCHILIMILCICSHPKFLLLIWQWHIKAGVGGRDIWLQIVCISLNLYHSGEAFPKPVPAPVCILHCDYTLASKTKSQHNPKSKSHHLILLVTRTAWGQTSPAGVASKRIHAGLCKFILDFHMLGQWCPCNSAFVKPKKTGTPTPQRALWLAKVSHPVF